MAGKNLLDVAKLFNAGRSIAKQHIVLRQQQWDVYSKTSTLARAAKQQTDRVTVTAGAAYELVKRFNETGPSWQKSASQSSYRQAGDEPAGRSETGAKTPLDPRSQRYQQGYAPAGAQDDTVVHPSSSDNGSLTSLQRREAQRVAERQIPAASANAQPLPEGRDGQDTFTERTENVSPELSSLPRIKVPKHQEQGQVEDAYVGNKSVNQDVYYTPGERLGAKEDEVPDGVSLEGAFASRKAGRVLGGAGPNIKQPYGRRQKLPPKPLPEMVAAQEQWKRQQEESKMSSQLQSSSSAESGNSDLETTELAESIAREADMQTEQSADSVKGLEPEKNTESLSEMHESRVPSSRFGRLWQYGGLATSMAFGAVGESFRRFTGGSGEGSLMLSESNMNRLVAKLSRMRGAALKLGQMMSFQDSKLLPPTINAVLQRVQDSADYMPPSQRDKVLVDNLGSSWRELFANFEERPFAAASIGQVHKATLASNGKAVAVKVQYPGVRNSIDSDLNNLALLLTASKLLPKGLYLDKTIANARVELSWECDYDREAEACMRFRELLADEIDTFQVPEIYKEASGPGVLTAEYMVGTAVTKMKDLSQHDRDWVGTQILRLCLRELMEWRFMQTDPNWTNFLYNRDSQKLELLDFGASRDYPDKFVEPYVSLLIAASKGEREKCRDRSIELGYLTGHESRDMVKAHVDSILTLAEPFVETAPEVYDFEDQTITDRVRANIGLMLRERLAPPPEETYSLHRKLSGAFLLCARLQSKVRARDMFASAVEVWNGRQAKV